MTAEQGSKGDEQLLNPRPLDETLNCYHGVSVHIESSGRKMAMCPK